MINKIKNLIGDFVFENNGRYIVVHQDILYKVLKGRTGILNLDRKEMRALIKDLVSQLEKRDVIEDFETIMNGMLQVVTCFEQQRFGNWHIIKVDEGVLLVNIDKPSISIRKDRCEQKNCLFAFVSSPFSLRFPKVLIEEIMISKEMLINEIFKKLC